MASQVEQSSSWVKTILVMVALAIGSIAFGAFVVGPLFQRSLSPRYYKTALAQAPEAPDQPYSAAKPPPPTGSNAPAVVAPSQQPADADLKPKPATKTAASTDAGVEKPASDGTAASAEVKVRVRRAPVVAPPKPDPKVKPAMPAPKPEPKAIAQPAPPAAKPAPKATKPAPKPEPKTAPMPRKPAVQSASPPAARVTYYRVRVGDYASRGEAAKARAGIAVKNAAKATVTPSSRRRGRFQLQAGVFRQKANAEKIAAVYRAQGLSVLVVEYTPDRPLPAPPSKPK